MTYYIEKSRNPNLENTAIPNLFITDFLPDVPDGDYLKIYIYAYMCCSHGLDMSHAELADRLGIPASKVIAAWRYFADRSIVNLRPHLTSGEEDFDIEFVDVKGVLYGREKANGEPSVNLGDERLASMFQKIAALRGNASMDGADAQRIISWMEEYGATPELIERAWSYSLEKGKDKGINYVGTIVRDWAARGLKTNDDVGEYLIKRDERNETYKKLMKALGLPFRAAIETEEKLFDLWLDDYGYTPEQLLEFANKTAGAGNTMQYLEGIIRKEREAEGKSADGPGIIKRRKNLAARKDYYDREREKNEQTAAANLQEVHNKIPEVYETDNEIVRINNEIIQTLTSDVKDKEGAMKKLNNEIEVFASRRKELLKNAGYPEDYTDVKYTCALCNDRGLLENGAICDCYPE
jgi:DnaD/phage-associated family protein